MQRPVDPQALLDRIDFVGDLSDLLGLRMALSPTPLKQRARVLVGAPFADEPNLPRRIGSDVAVAPSVHCTASDVSVIARYADGDRPAVVMKRFADHTVVWSGVAPVPPALLRALARTANVHVYSDTNDALFAGHNLITLHAAKAGTKRITLPAELETQPLYGASPARRNGRTLSFEMEAAETRSFHVRRR